MQNKINILPDILINKIAAGEVVQRPVSVVKELVENSIDANATNITVIIKDGGKKLIEIIDDGDGMGYDDLLLSFERHATSKIKSFDDLSKISSMGFRGEALPSIASISRVEATSKLKDSDTANVIKIEGGVVIDVKPAAIAKSTSIKISDIFYNVPARRKFLKEARTEYRHIYSYMKKAALSHPNIGFSLVNDGKVSFEVRPQELKDRISSLFSEVSEDSLISVAGKLFDMTVSGYVGKKELARKTKDNQILFVNGRYVDNKVVSFAVFQAYKDMLEQGVYPFFILFISLPYSDVDVNVHPSKQEIKFNDENAVRRLVKDTIFNVLASQKSLVTFEGSDGLSELDNFADKIEEKVAEYDAKKVKEDKPNNTALFDADSFKADKPLVIDEPKEKKEKDESKSENPFYRPKKTGADILKFRSENIYKESVWQLHNKYIMLEVESGMAMIDQHVAQERIYFEKALKSFGNSKLSSQTLLFPVKVDMSYEDRLHLEEIMDYLTDIGFMIRHFGKNTFIIEGVPIGVETNEEEKELLDIIDYYKKYREKRMTVMESVAASYACKRSIKAGQKLTYDEIVSLVNDLFMCRYPHVCPHGRPIIVTLPLKEIDKKFGRI